MRINEMKRALPELTTEPKERSTLVEQTRKFDPYQPARRLADDGDVLLCVQAGVWLYHHGTRRAQFVTESEFDIPGHLGPDSQIAWAKARV